MAIKRPGEGGGIKNLLAQHVEKAALGIAGLMVFVFLYFGMAHKPLGEDREPVALERAVKSADDHVEEPTWGPHRRIAGITDPVYSEKADEDSATVAADVYALRWFDPPFEALLQPRLDPSLIPLAKIVVQPGVIVALASEGGGAAGGGLGGLGKIRGGGAGDGGGDDGPPVLNGEQLRALQVGFQPANRGMAAAGTAMVVVRGIVPVLEQRKAYDDCFVERMGYDAGDADAMQRDRPNYIYYYVERQEVDAQGNPVAIGKTADGQPQFWLRLNTRAAMQQVSKWPKVEELADPRFVDELMTMQPPPILLRDYDDLIMHPDVPLRRDEADAEEAPKARPGDGRAAPDIPGDVPGIFEPGAGGREGIERQGPRPEAGGEGEAGPAVASVEKPVEYKLFRFYDFDVVPSKRYKYRVKLLLEDPNNPKDDKLAPSTRFLEKTVAKRLAEQKQADQASSRRTFWRETDWSEESSVISFPGTSRMLAGGVTAARTMDVPGKRAKIQIKEATAQLMALKWNPSEAVWVPGVVEELVRGSVVDFKKDVWVVDPVAHDFRRLSDYEFNTGYVVADLTGGEKLPSTNRKSQLTSPGEVLLIGEDGSLEVCSEFEDADSYHRYFYSSGSEGDSGRPRPRPRKEEEERGKSGKSDLNLIGGS